MEQSNARRLAKNTMFMYIRMFVLLIISLYTSRVLLQQLGVEDYGVYNLVGSIIAMFASLRGLFMASTQRFLNFEMGKGHTENLQTIFNMSIYINLIISLVFVLVVEIVGYWFLNYKINIDPMRLHAAKWVFQFAVATTVITIMTTPYDAVIIANEKMNFYAYMSIIEGAFKLLIIFTLIWWNGDKLIFYSFLVFCVQIIVRLINSLYCKKHFPESRYKLIWNKNFFKDMASFAGWNFFGNLGYSLCNEGINIILNIFGGAIVNAARGIAMQVRSVIMTFTDNVNIALNPYSTKIYAQDDKEKFYEIMQFSSKILFIMYICMIIPFCFYSQEILKLWLGVVPPYASIFVILILIDGIFKSYLNPINLLFFSANKLQWYQSTNIILSTCLVLISYFLLKNGFPLESVFVLMGIISFCKVCSYLYLAKKQCGLDFLRYVRMVIMPTFFWGVISLICCFFIYRNIHIDGFFFLLLSVSLMAIIIFIISIIGILNKKEKLLILSIIKK